VKVTSNKAIVVTILPIVHDEEIERQEVLLAKINLDRGWKVEAKFKAYLKSEKKSKQEQWVAAENKDLFEQVAKFQATFDSKSKILPMPAFNLMPIAMIIQKIGDSNLHKFVDTTFLPTTDHCEDISVDSSAQLVYQWRRPKQF